MISSKSSETEVPNKQSINMKLEIDNIEIPVIWENNVATQELRQRTTNEPIRVHTERYAQFEQVGKLPFSLFREDIKQTAQPGDIMLYQGDYIVIFYGKHSWSYTKLGSIQRLSPSEVNELLNKTNTQIEIIAKE
ncbi:hypothetical protein GP475_01595 [Corynebacterium poyangense]|uniref:Cyclophilin-like domain-containing protein n=1 Tax=Corynebacterium poyangense TaxID=2684405 RepID=A0A7H0SLN9_9CORY|nr:cyclophilin-like fold protein [Corynebacterium poyangense]QNQ89464.1 hypothetical protein GP475_01595 [Corynebacterium poyangense]